MYLYLFWQNDRPLLYVILNGKRYGSEACVRNYRGIFGGTQERTLDIPLCVLVLDGRHCNVAI